MEPGYIVDSRPSTVEEFESRFPEGTADWEKHVVSSKPVVPLRVVAAPSVTGVPWEIASGEKGREALLTPLSMREKALVCAVAEALKALEERAQVPEGAPVDYALSYVEKQGLLGLLVAFEDATGCKFSEAVW